MILREYKVKFKNNRPIDADPLTGGMDYQNLIKCTQKGHNRFINWLVVFAYDEKDAIRNATQMVKEYLSPHMGLA